MKAISGRGGKEFKRTTKVMMNFKKREEGKGNTDTEGKDKFVLGALVDILKGCAMQKDLHKGNKAHARIIRRGLLEQTVLCNSLVNMYAKCGALKTALELFYEIPVRTLVSWNVLIAGFAQSGHFEEAFHCFEQMQGEGFSPDAVTFVCVLKACGSVINSNKGQDIHLNMIRGGLFKTSILVGNALLDMYAKCGLLLKVEAVFNELPARDVVSWTTLIGAYVQHGHGEEALHFFERMQQEGFSPNVVTFIFISKVCGMKRASEKGQEAHARCVKQGLLAGSIMLGTALMDMYTKCGMFSEAAAVMVELPLRNVVSWTALITGYAQGGFSEKALFCFEEMQCDDVAPNTVTFVCILKACSSLGVLYKGQQIHTELVKEALLEESPNISTALFNMYAKSGMILEAQDVFDELCVQDVACWNALLAGYAQLGEEKFVFKLVDKMVSEGSEPDEVTLIVVLNACSHRGLLREGQLYFLMMSPVYGIIPTSEHHNCMIDLFGSSGQLDKAVSLIMKMPFLVNASVWHTMLGACKKWGDKNFGKWAFEHAAQLDDNNVAAYVLMSNIYAAAAGWEEEDGQLV